MGADQPFIYQPVQKQSSTLPYKEFDPKAVTRASFQPRPQKPKQNGPLLSFNRHPDSYLVMSTPNGNARISPSMKNRITQTRIAVLVFRVFQLLGALGALVTMILITEVDTSMGWVMRIAPGIAILHTTYGIYHLSRKASGRTPGSSASYMLFASVFDVSIMALYAVSAATAFYQWDPKDGLWETTKEVATWSTWPKLLEGGPFVLKMLFFSAFLCYGISALFYLITLSLSIWLFFLFRKIVKLPPDMNPLEDNLTSRAHKRNKSSVSTMSTYDEKRNSSISAARRSGAPYEDLSRPPSIPFMHTRTNSSDSHTTYYSIPTSSSPRDSRLDLPSRQYQLPHSNPPRTSVHDLKRASQSSLGPSPPKLGSCVSVSGQEPAAQQLGNDAWFSNDSLSRNRRSQPPSPVKSTRSPTKLRAQSAYAPLQQDCGTYEDIGSPNHGSDIGSSTISASTNPLSAHPIAPRRAQPQRIPAPNRESALGEIAMNRTNTVVRSTNTGDLADSYDHGQYDLHFDDDDERYERSDLVRQSRQGQDYRKLTPGPNMHPGMASAEMIGHGSADAKVKDGVEGFKSKYYGELRAATPPVLVSSLNGRQVSSGNDAVMGAGKVYARDVSGKVAEEGRGGMQGNGWGARFRKVSGI